MNTSIIISVVKSPKSILFTPADWSIVNLTPDAEENQAMLQSLYNTPHLRHATLILARQKRKHRLDALSSLHSATQCGWQFLESVTISYEKPSSCSNNGFLPISEHGWLCYKGTPPDAKRTKWFNEEASNATTLWDVAARENEEFSRYHKFSAELGLIMYSLCGTLEHRAFIYLAQPKADEMRGLYYFCKMFTLKAYLYVTSQDEAQELISECNRASDLYK
jgi:hypothetical protein